MKEMIYEKTGNRVLLDRGIYKDHEYFVISMGTHPCAYIKLNDENPMVAENLPCHGGIPEEVIEGNIVGWDYAHYGDYMGYYEENHNAEWDGQRYTTEEIVAECHEFIDELIERWEE